jgi:hypothetical protein
MEKNTNTIETVGLLIGAAKSDTIYRDIYVGRARELLSSTLDNRDIALFQHRKRSMTLCIGPDRLCCNVTGGKQPKFQLRLIT